MFWVHLGGFLKLWYNETSAVSCFLSLQAGSAGGCQPAACLSVTTSAKFELCSAA